MPKCPKCQEKMIQGWIKTKPIKGSGTGPLVFQIWICPHMQTSERKELNIFYYCNKPTIHQITKKGKTPACPNCGEEMLQGWLKAKSKEFKNGFTVQIWMCQSMPITRKGKHNIFYYCDTPVGKTKPEPIKTPQST